MQRLFLFARLFTYIALPIILIILPINYFDEGSVKCVSKMLLDTECPACGLTRACMRIIHLDFEGAYYFNRLSFFVFPLLAYLWASWFWKDYKTLRRL